MVNVLTKPVATMTHSDVCFLFFHPWSVQFIVVFVVKVLKMKEVNDVREYEDEDGSKVAAGLLNDSPEENNDDGAGHHITTHG